MLTKSGFGKVGLQVSRLGFGAMSIGGAFGRPDDDSASERVLNLALDRGINFIDTAPIYGRSEEVIGQFVGHRRSEYFLATKFAAPWGREPSAENARIDLENSLRRLRTDSIDLWQIHSNSPEDTETHGLLDVMRRARDAGKVRFLGISVIGGAGEPAFLEQRNIEHCEGFLAWDVFDAIQISYSALDPHMDKQIAAAHAKGLGIVIRDGVAKGEASAGNNERLREIWDRFERAGLDELRAPNESRTSFLMRLTFSNPDADTVIVGTGNPKHLEENLVAAERGLLTPEIYRTATDRIAAVIAATSVEHSVV